MLLLANFLSRRCNVAVAQVTFKNFIKYNGTLLSLRASRESSVQRQRNNELLPFEQISMQTCKRCSANVYVYKQQQSHCCATWPPCVSPLAAALSALLRCHYYVGAPHALCGFFARFRLTFWGQRIAARPFRSGQSKKQCIKERVNIIGNNSCCGSTSSDHNQHSKTNESNHSVINNSFRQSTCSYNKINYLKLL